MSDTTSPFFSTTLAVRISDINHGNHLDFARLIGMVGQARALLFQSHELPEQMPDGLALFVRDLQVKYTGQAFFDDKLNFEFRIEKFQKNHLSFAINIENITQGYRTAECILRLVFFNLKTQAVAEPSQRHCEVFGDQTS